MNTSSSLVPPGFRFHPTDEELVDYYLRRKVTSRQIDLDVIKDVDLYKIEPWDLQEVCRIGREEQINEWYFFSHKDKKYPTGTRTNRATAAGFWKATGRDKAIYSKHHLIGMRKTLVFYEGRAPNGQKSDWIMHEYRLENDQENYNQEDGWVVCKAFKKRIATTIRKLNEYDHSPIRYEDQVSLIMPADMDSPKHHYPYGSCKKLETDLHYEITPPDLHGQLPYLESYPGQTSMISYNPIPSSGGSSFQCCAGQVLDQCSHSNYFRNITGEHECCGDDIKVTDWRVLDKFVASQLSQEEDHVSKEHDTAFLAHEESNLNEQEIAPENASTSSSTTCHFDLWN